MPTKTAKVDYAQVLEQYRAVVTQLATTLAFYVEEGDFEDELPQLVLDADGALLDFDPLTDEKDRRELQAFWDSLSLEERGYPHFWKVTRKGRVRRAA